MFEPGPGRSGSGANSGSAVCLQAEDPIQDGQGAASNFFGLGLAGFGLGHKVEDRGQPLDRVQCLSRGESNVKRLRAFSCTVTHADELKPGVPEFLDQPLGGRGAGRLKLAGCVEQAFAGLENRSEIVSTSCERSWLPRLMERSLRPRHSG